MVRERKYATHSRLRVCFCVAGLLSLDWVGRQLRGRHAKWLWVDRCPRETPAVAGALLRPERCEERRAVAGWDAAEAAYAMAGCQSHPPTANTHTRREDDDNDDNDDEEEERGSRIEDDKQEEQEMSSSSRTGTAG